MKVFTKIRQMPRPVCWLIARTMRLLGATLRVELRDPHDFISGRWERPYIFVIWHNRMVSLPSVAPRHARERITFLASRSRDGGYISTVLGFLRMGAVRGSSSRGGAEALRRLRQYLEQGRSLVITPDGPRGPRYEVQDGTAWLALRCGVPVVPVSVNALRHWELNGWDRTQIPKPFSRVELVLGDPVSFDPEAMTVEECRAEIENRLLSVTRDVPESAGE